MSPTVAPARAEPSPEEVWEELSRVLECRDFRSSERRRDLLRHLVEAGLMGRTEQLKGYTIGIEVFDRGESFDPQSDPIVRLEVSRLRRDLEHYYLTSGADDPVLISIPKGGNAPSFEVREPRQGPPPTGGRPTPSPPAGGSTPVGRVAPWPWPWVAVALVLAVGLAYAWRGYLRRSDESSSSLRSAAQTVPVHAGRTALVILPFDYTSDSTRHPFLDGGLVSEIVGALAVHPGIAVIAPGTAAEVAMRGLTPPEIADLLAVDYVVRGDIRQEAQRVRVTVSMIEPRSSMIQLSKRYDGTLERVLDLQAEIARDLAGSVATGVTPSLVRRLPYAGTVDPEVLALYQEATSLRHPPSDPVRSRLAEDAYRRVIELDPDFAGGHAGLAFVLALRSWWGVSEQPETDVRRALEAARLAVEKEPDSGRARISLAIVLNVLGDRDGSLAAAEHAAILSPSDPYVLAFTGIFRAFAGEFDAAIPPAREAVRLDPLSARRPFRNMAGVVLYHAGRFEEAHEAMSENVRLGGPDGPHMACYRAAALARLGSMEEARAELAKAEEFPYEFDIRDFLGAFADPRDADELLDTLGSIAAGLDAPVTQKRAASRNTP